MLESDYPTRFGRLIESSDCHIELPQEWIGFFHERGEVAAYLTDDRGNTRLKVRTHGLMWVEKSLPFIDRDESPTVVYTKDFSRSGTGFLVPFELFPEECVRIVLATFWVQLRIIRTRRITSKCYEIGGTVLGQHDPSPDAFDLHHANV